MNGTPTDVNDDGSFTADVGTTDIYTFNVQDTLQHESSTQYRNYRLPYANAIRGRVNQSGLDFIADELTSTINDMDLNKAIGVYEFFSNVTIDANGKKRGVEALIENLSLNVNAFSLDPTNHGIFLDGGFDTVFITINLTMHNGSLPKIQIKPMISIKTIYISSIIKIAVKIPNLTTMLTQGAISSQKQNQPSYI